MYKNMPKLLLLAFTFVLEGCATPNYFKPVTNTPPDKALVYLYRKYNYFGSGVAHKIYANQKPVTLLYTSDYYPYLSDPGHVTFTAKQVSIGETHLFDFMISKYILADINVEAGKTYYLSFDASSGLKFKMQYSLKDASVGMREITNCILAECLETNLVQR